MGGKKLERKSKQNRKRAENKKYNWKKKRPQNRTVHGEEREKKNGKNGKKKHLERRKNNKPGWKEKTSYLVEVVVDAMITCRRCKALESSVPLKQTNVSKSTHVFRQSFYLDDRIARKIAGFHWTETDADTSETSKHQNDATPKAGPTFPSWLSIIKRSKSTSIHLSIANIKMPRQQWQQTGYSLFLPSRDPHLLAADLARWFATALVHSSPPALSCKARGPYRSSHSNDEGKTTSSDPGWKLS